MTDRLDDITDWLLKGAYSWHGPAERDIRWLVAALEAERGRLAEALREIIEAFGYEHGGPSTPGDCAGAIRELRENVDTAEDAATNAEADLAAERGAAQSTREASMRWQQRAENAEADRDRLAAALEAERIENAHLREAFVSMERAYNETEAKRLRDLDIQAKELAYRLNVQADLAALRQRHAEAVEAVNAKNVLTCVYCGAAYPPGSPTHGSSILTAHVRICPQHPMREAEATGARLRAALVGLVGVDGAEELDAMEAFIRLAPAPDVDKAATINAIDALRATAKARLT